MIARERGGRDRVMEKVGDDMVGRVTKNDGGKSESGREKRENGEGSKQASFYYLLAVVQVTAVSYING